MLLPSTLAYHPETAALIGRHQELRTAIDALHYRDLRLLTVIGPAGVGKTRFAIEVAKRMEPYFADGVIAIDLATLIDASEFAGEVTRRLGLVSHDPNTLGDQVEAYLTGKEMLLVIDNAEHVLSIGSQLVAWLGSSPGTRALVTSRHRLDLSMEHELHLAPLPVHSPSSTQPSPAAELFLHLMTDEIDDEPPSKATLELVEQVCQRVEGLPLAIELVAARLPSLSKAALRQFLEEDSQTNDIEQALRREVETSYRLVSSCAQQIFRYLTVFTGSFSLELVERQRAHSRVAPMDDVVFDCLVELSDHQLIQPVADAEIDTPRFYMLVMVAESGRRMLTERGEYDDARQAHARAMIDYAERREYSGLRPKHEFQTIELAVNYHNLISALTWLRDHNDDAALLQLIGGLTWFWYAQGHFRVGREWFETVIRRDAIDNGLHGARFLTGYGIIVDIQGDFDVAIPVLRDARERFAAIDHVFGLSYTCLTLGFCSIHLGRHDDAERYLREALDHAAKVDDRALAGTVEGLSWANIGANNHERGHLDEAEDALRRAVTMHRKNAVLWGECRTLCDLGDLDRDRGRLQLAMASYQAVIAPALRLGDRRLIAASLAGLATVLAHDGQATMSTYLWGAVDALLPLVGQPSFLKVDLRAFETGRTMARHALGNRQFEESRQTGEHASLDDVLELVGNIQLRLDEELEIPESIARRLTGRERDVLHHLVVGASNKSIGATLGITERTVSSHIASIFRKLNVNSRLEVVSAVVRT